MIQYRTAHYLLPFYPGAALAVAALAARLTPFGLARLLPPACALVLLVLTAAEPRSDEVYEPSFETLAMARVAQEVTEPHEPIYSLSFYAPALGYYADRRWLMMTTSDRTERILTGIHILRNAGTIVRVPPFPEGRLVVVTAPSALIRAKALGFRPERVLARTGHFLLVEGAQQ